MRKLATLLLPFAASNSLHSNFAVSFIVQCEGMLVLCCDSGGSLLHQNERFFLLQGDSAQILQTEAINGRRKG